MANNFFLVRTVKPNVNGLLVIPFTKGTPRPPKARHMDLAKYSLLLKEYCMNTYVGTLLNVCFGNKNIKQIYY